MRVVLSIGAGLVVSCALFGLILGQSAVRPATSYAKHHAHGTYVCSRCGEELFASEAKFDSTTRWPSFRSAVASAVTMRPDNSYGMRRVEVLCARCGAHLGHVFPDGRLTGDTAPDADMRYCILSESLDFRGDKSQ